jgi:hypothetical protein
MVCLGHGPADSHWPIICKAMKEVGPSDASSGRFLPTYGIDMTQLENSYVQIVAPHVNLYQQYSYQMESGLEAFGTPLSKWIGLMD